MGGGVGGGEVGVRSLIKPLIAKLFNLNFYPLEVVSTSSE